MGVAVTLENFLKVKNIPFDIVEHNYSEGSFDTAKAAHIARDNLVKGVVFRDEDMHYTMVALPSNERVLRHTLNQIFDRHFVLADEDELEELFFDCEPGAIPCLGQAYGVSVIWDDSLKDTTDFWLDMGNKDDYEKAVIEFEDNRSSFLPHDH